MQTVASADDDEQPHEQISASIRQESKWVQKARAMQTLNEIEAALFECVCRLNCTRKLRVMPKLPVKLPESWRVNLASHVSRDILSATATLFAEDLQTAEVSFKHARAAGGIYKAQIKAPLKLQQLQDCGNRIVRTMKALNDGREKYETLTRDGKFNQHSGEFLSAILIELRDLIKECLVTLSPPDLRTYHELYNSSAIGFFEPPPPPDVLISFYVSVDRCICTAYQMAPKQGTTHCLTSYHCEARLDPLVHLHERLSWAHWSAASLFGIITMFNANQPKLHSSN